jgi:tRNA 2-thiocytidine biosynthesis protein TtcA
MIQGWDRKFPGRVDNMFTALANVVPSHLMDRKLYPFATVKPTQQPVPDGDIAFDEEESCGDPATPDGATKVSFPALQRQRVVGSGEASPFVLDDEVPE